MSAMPTRALNELEISSIEDIIKSEKWEPPFFAFRLENDIDSLGDQSLWVWGGL